MVVAPGEEEKRLFFYYLIINNYIFIDSISHI